MLGIASKIQEEGHIALQWITTIRPGVIRWNLAWVPSLPACDSGRFCHMSFWDWTNLIRRAELGRINNASLFREIRGSSGGGRAGGGLRVRLTMLIAVGRCLEITSGAISHGFAREEWFHEPGVYVPKFVIQFTIPVHLLSCAEMDNTLETRLYHRHHQPKSRETCKQPKKGPFYVSSPCLAHHPRTNHPLRCHRGLQIPLPMHFPCGTTPCPLYAEPFWALVIMLVYFLFLFIQYHRLDKRKRNLFPLIALVQGGEVTSGDACLESKDSAGHHKEWGGAGYGYVHVCPLASLSLLKKSPVFIPSQGSTLMTFLILIL